MKKFRVEFKVPASHLGDVLASIHGHVEDLDVSMIEEVPHNKNVKHTRRPRGGTRDIIMQALSKSTDNTLTLSAARKLLEQSGFVGDGVYTAKMALVNKGLIDYKNGTMRLKK